MRDLQISIGQAAKGYSVLPNRLTKSRYTGTNSEGPGERHG
jgi:hypothetical protein